MEPKKVTTEAVNQLLEKCEEVAQKRSGDFAVKGEETLAEVLHRDPVAEVEKILGKKVAGDSAGEDALFALGHAFRVNEYKNRKLAECDDTSISNTVDRYHRIIGEIGFEKVLEIQFASERWKETECQNERLYIFWRKKGGLLLSHDTFEGKNVNSGKVYFNWHPNESGSIPERASGWYRIENDTGEVPYSESYPNGELTTDPEVLARMRRYKEKWDREAVWAGDIDCREAIRHRIRELERTGTFVTPWKFRPFLWLLHYEDKRTSHKYYKQINEERIAILPEFVQQAITPTVHV